MAETIKVLGQSSPAADTDTLLYTVPASTEAVVSTINVCNTGSANVAFRIWIRVGGAATATKQYLAYDQDLDGNFTWLATLGITLGAADEIYVRADSANVAFQAFGTEIT